MNVDEIDRDRYRDWWEREGRADLGVCPCGQPAEDWALEGSPTRVPAGHGLCPRHRFDLSGADRETFAQWIIAGTFIERDLTYDQETRAARVAKGRQPFDA